jgi:hypothetical protein
MAIDFSKFDKAVDIEGLKKDVVAAADGQGDFKEVPHGTYEVSIDKLELVESKKGDPMVTCWFKILEGEYKGQRIFMNQVVTLGFQIHIVDEFLESLESGVEVKFESFAQYGKMLLDIHEAIDNNLEYAVEYGENKGFNTFKIVDVYELED